MSQWHYSWIFLSGVFVFMEQRQNIMPKAQISNVFLFLYFLSFFSFQMQCGQQSITSGVAQSHHHPICRKWEVVSGPPRHLDGKHSSHGIQHQDPKCWHPRWRALCLLNPHEQETKIHKSASHCSRYGLHIPVSDGTQPQQTSSQHWNRFGPMWTFSQMKQNFSSLF